ncbi:single-stranded DNA-binding protein [Clostridium perfringens]|uniref:Single-stranded DNA-binding protein n=2 Tax=Clostridium perfringens TaxID=1502 RepID=A0AAP7BX48_CLOPF|nr:single-stranded DNA-binding protein [Clostridium perfringens]EDT23805.1 single-strand binding protein family [Clostridium perfringens B str. ATCC 3626]NGU31865.1 single-stranded DNA-binding protein [Clostridium perfringens]WEV05955.1 single-stranded DNA-binding protein [Clostridium perfringens B]
MNKIVLGGKLVKEPELKFLDGDGKAVARFTIAVSRKIKGKDGKRETDFFNCVIFGKLAEGITKYANKGQEIILVGEVRNRSYEDKDKIKRYITEVYVSEFDLFGNYKKEENNNIDYPEELDGDIPF